MPTDHAIEAVHLIKVFRTRWTRRQIRAVNDISFSVPRGSAFGLLGPNGAGKTTFVKMLLSAVHPTSGSARIFGLDAADPKARVSIGYLPENHRFPTYLTGAGMLDLYGGLSGVDRFRRKKLIPELLEQVGLDQWADVRLGKYSKGMLQRVGLAQALIHSPRLLILDEPSDGVDPVGRRQVRELLAAQQRNGVTIFMNSHLLAEVEQFCSEVAILRKGQVALAGNIKDLTIGRGYRITTSLLPEQLRLELERDCLAVTVRDGTTEFQYPRREAANRAIDALRAQRVEIESLVPTTSTLEDVFLRIIETGPAQ